MNYRSTRNAGYVTDSARAVLEGLAPDGGLYLPEQLPEFDAAACLKGSTMDMAEMILSALLPDIPEMGKLVRNA